MTSKLVEEITEILLKHLPYFEGQRHQLCLAVAGWLRKRGFTREEVAAIIERITCACADEETEDRLATVSTTYEKELDEIAGWTALVEFLGEETANALERKVPVIYTYTDEQGRPLYRILRWDDPGLPRGKTFELQHFDGQSWRPGLGNSPLVLYRLPRVREAISCGRVVFLVEGEKCVHAVERLGLTATTNPFGALTWKDEFTEQLRGVEQIIILPDNDSVGRKHARKVLKALQKHGIRAKIVELPGLGPGEDVADLIARGEMSREKLLALVQTESGSTTEVRNTSAVLLPVLPLTQAVERLKALGEGCWIVEKAIPERGFVVFAARPKFGKTEVLLKVVADILAGRPCFGREVQPVRVLWVTQEDSLLRLQEGLLGHGVGPETLAEQCLVLDYSQVNGLISGEALLSTAREYRCQLVILEPLAALAELATLGRRGRLSYEALYGTLNPLALKAKQVGVCLLGVWHSSRGRARLTGVEDVIEAPMGSTAYSAVADSILALGLPPGSADSRLRRIMAAGRGVELDHLLEWTGRNYVERTAVAPEIVALTPERKAILEAIQELGDRAKPLEISNHTGLPYDSVKHLLRKMEELGLVNSSGGVYQSCVLPPHEGRTQNKFHSLRSPAFTERREPLWL